MANQGPVGNRMKRFARTADIRASNFLTVSIFIVVLVTVACATSSYAVAHHQQHSSYSTSREHQPHLALKRSSPSTFENFEPLFERPQVYSEYKPTLNGQRDQDFDAADEEFLRQLKEAARYLDDKLAERQRQQEQLALLERASANGFARRPYGELNGRQQFDDDAAREPVYSVLDEQRLAEPHVGSDLSWRPLNEAANTNDVTEIEPDVTDEASVVVVAPSGANGASKLISSAPDVVDDYRLLLADQLEEQNQRQNAFNTDAKYKQSLKSFLLDQAQANSLAPAANNDNQKRDAPAATPEPRSDTSQRAARFTTLLEDEDEDSAKKEDDAPASKVAYGTVYDRPAAANGTAPTGGGSLFKRLYSNVAYYLPFITQLSNLRRETASNTTTGTGDSVETNSGRQQGAVGDQLHAKTNISDSSTLGGSAPSEQNEGDIGETGGQGHRTAVAGSNQDNQQSQQNDDKHGVAASGTNSTSDPSENAVMIADPLIETSGRHSAGTTKKNDNRVDEPSYGLKRDRTRQFASENGDLDVDMSQMMSTALNPDGQSYDNTANQYNMMKQSSLMLPVGSSSDMLLESSPRNLKKEPDSLLGKYIYAPTQHYYLNSVMPPTDGIPHLGPLGHHPALVGKHFQAGDAVYGPYGEMPMKAAYAFQKERNTLGDKSNDLYFLIMVGAFCVMAMAVVLAAGMFAYRVQQSRKTSQDTDYPTYGVVGPNNMSAKCGAASFVGGYFTGPASGSSKSGSVKHLPDIYGIPGGNGGSDSGLNSLDKSSSNKKASSVSSLNEHHQSAGSRAGSSNFMAAASQDAARMYHYQHQKQQMIISDRSSGGRQTSASDLDSEDENDDGSYTVYECPGLASAHEMEIKNPLFNDDQSP